jgi:hypothetical protein
MSITRVVDNFGIPVKFQGIINADVRDVVTFFDDFIGVSWSATDNTLPWYFTDTGSGKAAIADATDGSEEMGGGLLALTCDTTNADVCSFLLCGESFVLTAGYELYLEARYMVVDVSATGVFIGLSQSDGSANAGLVGGIGFQQSATALNVQSDNAGGTVQTDALSGITPTDGVWNNVAFHYDGGTAVDFYHSTAANPMEHVHTLLTTTTADYVPMDLFLTPTIEAYAIASADGNADIVYVDYILVQMRRCRVAT